MKAKEWATKSVTFTSEGAIPYLLCSVNGQPFYAPPKVESVPSKGGNYDIVPVKRSGLQVYALPGGGEVVA